MNLWNAFSRALSKTREDLGGRVSALIGRGKDPGPELLEAVEEALIGADVGMSATRRLVQRLQAQLKSSPARSGPLGWEEIRELLKRDLVELFEAESHDENIAPSGATPGPFTVLVVGINGVGKTTTVGKLAARFRKDGNSVLLVAGDTFRAAAIEQLGVWAERTGSELVAQAAGADPSAVAFDALAAARARGLERVLVDTAGRLHTKTNLMEELKKIKRVMGKSVPGCPHETWLVIDATTGQNALLQARMFHEAIGLSGLVITKLDGTAKGGILVAIAAELKIPVRYVGVGEAEGDLIAFDPRAYVDALLG